MIPISGFTIVRNARVLDFPVVESIRSMLPLCAEVVVNVGRSDDDTVDLVRSVDDPRVRILHTDWNAGPRHAVLRTQTFNAMQACRQRWGIYLQADEVLHESGVPLLQDAVATVDANPKVEALLLRYHHLFGDPDTEAVNRRWYRYEARVVRLDPSAGIRPYRDAQGFRVGSAKRRIRARRTGAQVFHYGHTRSAAALRARVSIDRRLYARTPPTKRATLLEWFPGLRPLQDSHPTVARAWVERHRDDPERSVSSPAFRFAHLRFYLSDIVERITGWRPFGFRNYTQV